MKTIFVDTFYWIALINKKDTWHQKVRNYSQNLDNVKLVTTQEVLVETVNFFASYPQQMKEAVYRLVEAIINDINIQVLPQNEESFMMGLNFFKNRFDKGYSLTDCISMMTIKKLKITEVLTHDKHFTQEGFIILFQNE